MESVNLAGRAGRWSAAHWKTAAFGWIAFAVLAVVVGSAVGAKQMKPWAIANGESRRAEQILDRGTSTSRRARACSSSRRRRRSTIRRSRRPSAPSCRRSRRQRDVDEHRLADRAAGRRARSRATVIRRSSSSTSGQGRGREGQDRADPGRDRRRRRPAPERDHRGVRPGVGRPPGRPALRARHEPRRVHVAAADDRDPRRRVRRARRRRTACAARVLGRARRDRPQPSPATSCPTDEQTLGAIILMIGMAVGIDYSLFYLRREREERHARPLAARRAAPRRRGRRDRRC